jgi:F5/8 type C domain
MSAHRYWRVFCLTSTSNAFSFAEIQFRTTAGVSLPFSGGTASAYNTFSTAFPANATDGNNATAWSSTDTTPGWWMYDFGVGNSRDVVEIMMTSVPGSYGQTPSAFIPQWSDDGTNWTSMATIYASWSSPTQTQLFAVRVDPGYANAGGTGNRTGVIIVTTTAILGNGVIGNLVDGSQVSGAPNSVWFNANQSGREVRFDFNMFGAPRRITEVTWYQDVAAVHGNWKWQGSNDGSAWTDIGAEFTLGSPATQVITTLSGNINFWRFYRMLQTAGSTSSNPWLREIEFAIDNTVDYPHAAMLTQIALEEWAVNKPDVLMTQIVLEEWASVGGAGFFSARHV